MAANCLKLEVHNFFEECELTRAVAESTLEVAAGETWTDQHESLKETQGTNIFTSGADRGGFLRVPHRRFMYQHITYTNNIHEKITRF